jgi:hypothetical protein
VQRVVQSVENSVDSKAVHLAAPMAVKRAADSVAKMVVLKAVRMADHWVF